MSRVRHATIYREIAIAVEYTVATGFAGDRVDPPCDPEIEIVSAKWNGVEVDLTDDDLLELGSAMDDGPDPDDARDRMVDDRLTAQMSA